MYSSRGRNRHWFDLQSPQDPYYDYTVAMGNSIDFDIQVFALVEALETNYTEDTLNYLHYRYKE